MEALEELNLPNELKAPRYPSSKTSFPWGYKKLDRLPRMFVDGLAYHVTIKMIEIETQL